MLDQSFSFENLRKIYDLEKRKGRDLDSEFSCFSKVETITKRIKTWNDIFNALNRLKKAKNISPTIFEDKVNLLNKHKKKHIEKRDAEIESQLNEISKKISQKNFKLTFDVAKSKKAKDLYKILPDSPECFFALKQLQENFRALYKVKTSDRRSIVSALKNVLNNGLPKSVIRTDITAFYESIPSEVLLDKIYDDSLFTYKNKELIKQVFDEYQRLSSSTLGVPRGVGVSAFLSELYMRDFDKAIKSDSRVIFYARYVDDIVVVTKPDGMAVFSEIEKRIADLKLEINILKTLSPEPFGDTTSKCFDYLGYSFKRKNNELEIGFSEGKVIKIKRRIDLCIEDFLYHSYINKRKSEKMLISRVKYLTSNTRLFGRKSHTYIGIYFSNMYLTNTSILSELDTYLQDKINWLNIKLNTVDPRFNFSFLIKNLQKCSFQQGFDQKLFREFKNKNSKSLSAMSADLHKIVKVWKNV